MERRVKERLIGATILLALIVLVVPELLSGPGRRLGSPPPAPPAASGAAEALRNVTVDLATRQATSAADTAEVAPTTASAAGAPSTLDAVTEPGRAAAGTAAADRAASGDAVPAAALGAGSSGAPSSAAAPTITTLKAQQPVPAVLDHRPPIIAVPAPASPVPAPPAAPKAGTENSSVPAAPSHHGWTVQVGSFASRENAEKLLRRVKTQNSSAHVVSSGTGAAQRYRVRIGPLPDRNTALQRIAKLKKAGMSASLIAP
jgi:DedD protein